MFILQMHQKSFKVSFCSRTKEALIQFFPFLIQGYGSTEKLKMHCDLKKYNSDDSNNINNNNLG